MNNKIRMISLSLTIFFIVGIFAFAQEPQSKSPVVTSEDVLRVSRGNAKANTSKHSTTAPATDTAEQQNAFAAAERSWNERLKRAQQLVKDLLNRADATELEVNQFK